MDIVNFLFEYDSAISTVNIYCLTKLGLKLTNFNE